MSLTRRGFIAGLAGGLLALRLNLGGGQAKIEESRYKWIPPDEWTEYLKRLYPPEAIHEAAYRRPVLLSMLKKESPGVYVTAVTLR